jgi:hypothetical protein
MQTFLSRLLVPLAVPLIAACFVSSMCAGPGVIIVPASLRLADWFLCPNGGTAVPHVLHNPYNPGEAAWNGDTSCIGEEGERIAGREDLAFPAMCVTYFVPFAVLFSIGWVWRTRSVMGAWSSAGPEASTPPPQPAIVDPQTRQEARELMARGNKIQAIKRVRERTTMGLKEAKDYVESLADAPADVGPVAVEPEPATEPSADEVETLRKIKQMMDEGLITIQEYEAKKSEILSRM